MDDKSPVRIATPDDVQALARLNRAFNGVDEPPERLAQRLSNPGCVEQVLIAEREARAVGFAALRIVPCVFYDHPYGELTELFVEEEYRRHGLGRKLLCLAETLAAQRGVTGLFVQTGLANGPARAF